MERPEAEKMGDELSKFMVNLIREHGSLDMTILVVSGDKTRAIRGFDANSHQQKALIAELARYLAQKHKADSVILSCESFTAHSEAASKEDMEDINRYRETHGTLEGHPLTVEAVFLYIEMPNDSVVRCYPFTRKDNGDVDEVQKPIVFPEGSEMDGTLCRMLDPKKRWDIPDEVLAEMEKKVVEVISTKKLGIYIDQGYEPSLH